MALLRQHDIGLVVDVRSSPYSRHAPQANRQALCSKLELAGIKYRWMGDRLGGMPDRKTPDYDELRQRPSFQQGIADLVRLSSQQPIAVMCAEGDHRRCHRHTLIEPLLLGQGVAVRHIQPDASLFDARCEPRQPTLI